MDEKSKKGDITRKFKTLWDSVRIAKDLSIESIPIIMFRDNIEVENCKLADSFACFFDYKVKRILESSVVCNNVFTLSFNQLVQQLIMYYFKL